VKRSRPIVLAGIGTALLGNYWVLEGALAKRTDPTASWISDLAARTEAFGWRFELLEIASGLAVVGFALLLLGRIGERSPVIRAGLLALAAEGVFTVAGGALPLSCAETLDPTCSFHYDALDVLHATAEFVATTATVLAFALIGLGQARVDSRRTASSVTFVIGAVWLVLTALTGLSYLNGDVESVKGLLQRASQAMFGAWLILLGVWGSDSDAGRQPVPHRVGDRARVP